MAPLAAAMQYDSYALRAVSNNIANLTTHGYKREFSVDRSAGIAPTVTDGAIGQLSKRGSIRNLDLSEGPLVWSGDTLDIATTGNSYFRVETTQGWLYTKSLHLSRNADGSLVDGKGNLIDTTTGVVVVPEEGWSVDAAGGISDARGRVGTISVYDISSAKGLIPRQGGYFDDSAGLAVPTQNVAPIKIGYFEGSNVDSGREMMALVAVLRHFETVQKLYVTADEMELKQIRKIGEF